MDLSFFFKGLVIGLSIAAQVGPMSILCIRRTLAEGPRAGFVSGLGVASADGLYGAIGGFGLTFISGFLVDQRFWLRLVGGAFLIYLGIKTWLSRPPDNPAHVAKKSGGLAGYYLSTFLLTLTNPMTILSFAAIFAGLGLASNSGDYLTATALIAGIFGGSTLWWLILTGLVNAFRRKFTLGLLSLVNRGSGLVIAIFGVVAIVSIFS